MAHSSRVQATIGEATQGGKMSSQVQQNVCSGEAANVGATGGTSGRGEQPSMFKAHRGCPSARKRHNINDVSA
jgi:hypothetical protein